MTQRKKKKKRSSAASSLQLTAVTHSSWDFVYLFVCVCVLKNQTFSDWSWSGAASAKIYMKQGAAWTWSMSCMGSSYELCHVSAALCRAFISLRHRDVPLSLLPAPGSTSHGVEKSIHTPSLLPRLLCRTTACKSLKACCSCVSVPMAALFTGIGVTSPCRCIARVTFGGFFYSIRNRFESFVFFFFSDTTRWHGDGLVATRIPAVCSSR